VESVSDALKIWKSLLCHVCFLESSFPETTFQTLCVCLVLGKLVNRKHFPVNGNTFQLKKNLVWFPGKCFSF